MKRNISSILFGIAILVLSFSSKDIKGQNIIPPSPNAASLGMYVDLPVSRYSGVPNINIPLYNIQANDFSLPISISYHASGIKVAQEASLVGLGWALNAGGCITRQVRGKEDFDRWFTDPALPNENDAEAISNYFAYTQNEYIIEPVVDKDGEPDIFFFNFNGYSGKFVMTKNKDVIIINPKSELKIKNISGLEWEITDPNGIKYTFSDYEQTQAYVASGNSPDEFNWPSEEQVSYVSSWFLSEIELTNKEKIEFNYTNIASGTKSFITISNDKKELHGISSSNNDHGVLTESCGDRWYLLCGQDLCSYEYERDIYSHSANIVKRELYLSSINWPSGSITTITSDRVDVDNELNKPQKLDWLKIFDKNNKEIKSYNFSYDHFRDDEISNPYKHLYLRLKLSAVTEYSAIDENSNHYALPSYTFDYDGTVLPKKNSTSTDYWGYYNGQKNTDFYGSKKYVPEYTCTDGMIGFGWDETSTNNVLNVQSFSLDEKYFSGADKECYPTFTQAAILKKIKYPTGGIIDFTFESNSYFNFSEEYETEPIEVSAFACMHNHCSPEGEPQETIPTASEMFYIPARTRTEITILSSDFNASCTGFTLPDGALTVSTLEKVQEDGTFISKLMDFKYEDFSNEDPCEFGYPNYSYHNIEAYLEEGWYKVTVDPYDDLEATAIIKYDKTTTNRIYEKIGGGLRIAKISNDATERIFKYEQETIIDSNPMTVSSGQLLSKPNHAYFETRYGICKPVDGYYTFLLLARCSDTTTPLTGFKSGNSIGYDKVSEIIVGSNGEKSIIEQMFYNQAEVLTLPFFPNIPRLNNGLLKSEKYYADNIKVKEKEFLYRKDEASVQSVKGLRFLKQLLHFYETKSEWWYPYQTIETSYDELGLNPITITTDLEYANVSHRQLSKSTQADLNGKTIITDYVYPSDANSGVPSEMWDETDLNYKHILNPIVDKTVTINSIPVSKTHTEYVYDSGKDMVLPDYTNTYPTGTSIGYKIDYEHDDQGKLIEQTKENDLSTYYLWAYNKQYPVAKITCSDPSLTLTTLQGNVDNITFSGSDVVSNISTDISSLQTALNSVLSSSNYQVTLYTYSPLIGITSQTDTNGKTSYSEYDDFGRLETIRDNNEKILNSYQYHYVGQNMQQISAPLDPMEEETSTLINGLLGCWEFDEILGTTVEDKLELNEGAIHNGVTIGQTGIIDNAYSYDGVDDYFKVGYDASLAPDNFSVSCWVNPDTYTGSLEGVLISAGGNGWTHGYRFNRYETLVQFHWGTGTAASKTLSLGNLEIGTWSHLVAVYDGTTVSVYFEGEFITSSTNAFGYDPDHPHWDHFFVGRGGGLNNFHGKVDQIGVWNRALTAGEITELYNSGIGKAYPFNNQ